MAQKKSNFTETYLTPGSASRRSGRSRRLAIRAWISWLAYRKHIC